jgi:microcystin-dependent protein
VLWVVQPPTIWPSYQSYEPKMAANNVQITSAVYANARGSLVSVLLTTGKTWTVPPGNGSGQANVLDQWVKGGGNIGPYVPPVPGGTVPVGTLIWYASLRTPSGWLPCDGSAVKRLQYPILFSVIGTTFGIGDGTKTFNLPDLTNRFIRGWGPVNNLDPDRPFASTQEDRLFSHLHSITDPGHIHDVTDPGHAHPVTDPGHTHTANDLGHTHSVSDPGHFHVVETTEVGYLGPISEGADNWFLTPPGYTPSNQTCPVLWNPKDAGLAVEDRSANIGAEVANAGLSDLNSFTGIEVDPATTGITTSFEEGGIETRPPNLSLLPYIKY